jgi:hypothetical protein
MPRQCSVLDGCGLQIRKPSFNRTVLETLPLMRRRQMLNALVALGDGPTRPQMSALDKQGRVDKGVSSMGRILRQPRNAWLDETTAGN